MATKCKPKSKSNQQSTSIQTAAGKNPFPLEAPWISRMLKMFSMNLHQASDQYGKSQCFKSDQDVATNIYGAKDNIGQSYLSLQSSFTSTGREALLRHTKPRRKVEVTIQYI